VLDYVAGSLQAERDPINLSGTFRGRIRGIWWAVRHEPVVYNYALDRGFWRIHWRPLDGRVWHKGHSREFFRSDFNFLKTLPKNSRVVSEGREYLPGR